MNFLRYRKIFLVINILSNILIFNKIHSETNNINLIVNPNEPKLDTKYLLPKNELEDYIIDTGDELYIEFKNRPRGFGKTKNNSYSTNDISYLNPRNDLNNYILDSGDVISINFFINDIEEYKKQDYGISGEGEIDLPDIGEVYVRGLKLNELTILLKKRYQEYLFNPTIEIKFSSFRFIESGVYEVNSEGEMVLPLIEDTYVRGLTITELSELLSKKYQDSKLIFPEVKIRIVTFKPQRILVFGEIRQPGILNFPAYSPSRYVDLEITDESLDLENNFSTEKIIDSRLDRTSVVKRPNEFVTTISNAIRGAGGITSFTDLSRIEIIRDIPLGKGGGKKRAVINFNSFIDNSDLTNDIRLFDGDRLYFPKLNKQSKDQIPKSILTGITPRFIEVQLGGAIETTGPITIPIEASLVDLIELSGPRKPLSGNVVLIRYERDGKVIKKYISYSSRAKPGSKRNPYLRDGDLITVRQGPLRKTAETLGEITEPFIGIYATKELINSFK